MRTYITNCIRCGVPVTSLKNPIYGNKIAHAKFKEICEQCCTPEERQEIQNAQLASIREGFCK